MPFCAWVLSLSMFSRLFQVIAHVSISFLFTVESIHSAVDGYLGYFHFGAIMNSVVMSIGLQVFIRAPAFNILGYIPRSEIVGACDNSTFNFLRSHQTFPWQFLPFYIPTRNGQRFHIHILGNLLFSFLKILATLGV